MKRETFDLMVEDLAGSVEQIDPWDLADELDAGRQSLLVDVRCPNEFSAAHIRDSLNVPRGIIELAVDYGYEETLPELVSARNRRVVVICRAGSRSIMAADTIMRMGYSDVAILRTGIRGWNDYERALYNDAGELLDPDWVERRFSARLSPEQLGPDALSAA